MRSLIGVISDTHGLIRPEAIAALQGVERIVHAGDIGALSVLEALTAVAPVTAVRGNNDHGPWAESIPEATAVDVGGLRLFVVHDRAGLGVDPRRAGFAAVITGHSHRPKIEERDGVLYLNPGSAGPRRFRLPVAIAHIHIDGRQLRAEIVSLVSP